MLFRSTGLGKTQLIGQVVELKRQGDFLIMHVDVTDPVKWRIRAAMSFRDLAKVMACCASRSIVSFILSPAQWRKKKPNNPGDF
jgi:hypothetical protein